MNVWHYLEKNQALKAVAIVVAFYLLERLLNFLTKQVGVSYEGFNGNNNKKNRESFLERQINNQKEGFKNSNNNINKNKGKKKEKFTNRNKEKFTNKRHRK